MIRAFSLPLHELFREGALLAVGDIFEAEILVDLQKSLLLMVITCE